MKIILKRAIVAVIVLAAFTVTAQKNRDLDNYRPVDKRGINVFENPKSNESTFNGVKVRVGGASTIQFQGLDQENSGLAGLELKPIGSNFNLATANFDLDVALYHGIRMHLRTYLSSRHHAEPYVKGGYIQIDKLDFVSEGFLENFMQYASLKIGHMENNYGDAHFRRTDNAQAIHNAFVGNLIMDSFTTEVGAELFVQKNGFLGMLGVSNGKLNQSVIKSSEEGSTGGASFLAKFGYDKQINSDFRFRLTGSIYNTGYVPNSYLYSADRAGSRYYRVLEAAAAGSDNFRSGRYNPNLRNQIRAIMVNPFVKYKGLEFFGTLESATGKATAEANNRTANQYSGELIYRFGKDERFYVGGRYNTIDAEDLNDGDVEISRFQLAGGWFFTDNVLMKVEYMNQNYDGFSTTNVLNEAKFNGIMLEATISF